MASFGRAVSERIYRAMLYLLPPGFRREYGADLVQQFRDRSRSAGDRAPGGLQLLAQAGVDLVANSVAEWARLVGRKWARRRSPEPWQSRFGVIGDLVQDVQFAFRSFLRTPGFTVVAIATLAIGIGANAASFSLVDSVLLHPFPFAGGDRLVKIWNQQGEGDLALFTAPDPEMVETWIERARSFDAVMAYSSGEFLFVDGGRPQRVAGANVTANMLAALGVPPLVGRVFGPEDVRDRERRAVMLSEGFWRSRFGSDPAAVGRTITLDDARFLIVGVVPAVSARALETGFFHSRRKDVWVPIPRDYAATSSGLPDVAARLRPHVSVAAARVELLALQRDIEGEGLVEAGWTPLLKRSREIFGDGKLETGLLIVFGAVTLVLLIACANLANMLLARGLGRGREFAVRSALGAGRARMARQLMAESLLLSVAGGVAGIMLAGLILHTVVGAVPDLLGALRNARVNPVVVTFTVAVTVVTGLAFGLAPAIQVRSGGITDALKGAGMGGGSASTGSLVRQGLVAGEVVIAVVLVLGAALMANSLARLQNVDPGFEPQNLLAVELTLPEERYPSQSQRLAFFEDVADRVASLPGVVAVAWANGVPPSLPAMVRIVEADAGGDPDPSPTVLAANWVSSGYFTTTGTRIIEGRAFATDEPDESTVIVNEALARKLWPGGGGVGQRINLPSSRRPVDRYTVVGVVTNVKSFGLDDDPDRAQLYFPFVTRAGDRNTVVVRIDGDAGAVVDGVREGVWAADPLLPIDDIRFVRQSLAGTIAGPRFNSLLLGLLAGIALLLAVVGVYGVVALSVRQRTREIGVRVALGAGRGEVLRETMSHGLRPVALGLVGGVAASLALTRFLESLLFEIQPNDPATYVAVSLVLALVGTLACLFPSLRAIGVDPVQVLRQE